MASQESSAAPPRHTALLRITVPLLTLLLCFAVIEALACVVISRGTMHLGIEMWKYAKHGKDRSANPEVGHRNRPNINLQLMGVNVQTESHGLRDQQERPFDKPPGTYRILVLGDSITFGWGTNYEKTFCRLLEKSLQSHPPLAGRRVEVLNTGVGNSNTAMEIEYLKTEGIKFQPDLVLLAWFINDAEPTAVPTGGWLANHSFSYVWLDSALDGVLRSTKNRATYSEFYRSLYDEGRPGWEKCQSAFEECAIFCGAKKLPCHVLLIPELHSLGTTYEFKDIHDKMRLLTKRWKLPTLELLDAFPGEADPAEYWVSPGDAHPNDRGNALMAARIDRVLREERWLGEPQQADNLSEQIEGGGRRADLHPLIIPR